MHRERGSGEFLARGLYGAPKRKIEVPAGAARPWVRRAGAEGKSSRPAAKGKGAKLLQRVQKEGTLAQGPRVPVEQAEECALQPVRGGAPRPRLHSALQRGPAEREREMADDYGHRLCKHSGRAPVADGLRRLRGRPRHSLPLWR